MTLPQQGVVRSLGELSDDIRATWADAKAHQIVAIEGYMRGGRLLTQAREQFPSDRKYSQWFRAQRFGFSTEWADACGSWQRTPMRWPA